MNKILRTEPMRYLPVYSLGALHRLAMAGAISLLIGTGTAFAGTVTTTTAFEYDPVTGLRTAVVQEPDNPQLNLRTQYTYNKVGQRLTTTVSSNATGSAAIPTRTTETLAYGVGAAMPSTSTNALGQTSSFGFDKMDMPAYINNLNGINSTFVFDMFQRKKTETRADGVIINWYYNVCGKSNPNPIDASCPAGMARYLTTQTFSNTSGATNIAPLVKTFYDEFSRVIRTQTLGFDGVSFITQDTEYNAIGEISRVSRPYYPNSTIQWTTNTYDTLGRLIVATSPDNREVKTAYNGLRLTATNPLNQTRTTVKNSLGQVIQVIDTQDNSLSYQYDAQGNLTKTTDPKGNTISVSYDTLGRKIAMTDPDQGTLRFDYDALGQTIKQTDAKNNVVSFIYDNLGRLTKRTEVDLISNWTYDACNKGLGKVCKSTTDNGFSVAYDYDYLSRPVKTTSNVDTTYITNTTYDTNGRIATQSYPTGLTVKYLYTSLGYLSEVRDNASNKLYWKANARDAEGHLTQETYGNNVVTQQVYEAATGRVKSIVAGTNNGVQNLSFTYDARGNLFTRNDANQNLAESFLYDTLNRITSNTVNSTGVGQVTQTYAYDSIGNIINRSDKGAYTYGAVNNRPHAVAEIALAGGDKRQYTYDANGNLTQEVQRDALGNVLAAKGRTETWTSFNMPLQITTPTSSASFVYGPEHQRIKKITPTGTTIYVHPDNAGGLSYEKEIKTNGTIEHRQFITAGDGVVALVKQTGTAPATTLYMHRDHLGSTTAITNETGAVIERLAYEPFGKRRTPAGALDLNSLLTSTNTDRGYTNHEELDDLDLIHMNGRVYDPEIGRFISADPNIQFMKDIQSYNRYSYLQNNPMTATDPTGFLTAAGEGQSCAEEFFCIESGISSGGGGGSGGSGGGEFTPPDTSALGGEIINDLQTVTIVGQALEPEEVSTTATVGSIIVDVIPFIGAGKSFIEVGTGRDPITKEPVNRGVAAAGIVAGIIPGGKLVIRGLKGIAKSRALGKAGEEAVKEIFDIGDKVSFRIGTRLRRPDGQNDTLKTVSEVKNVVSQDFTPQLQDYLAYSMMIGFQLTLYTRSNTIIEPLLKAQIDNGNIIRLNIPGA